VKQRETKREIGREREEIYREVRGERGALESGAGVGEGGAAVPCPLWGAAGSGLQGVGRRRSRVPVGADRPEVTGREGESRRRSLAGSVRAWCAASPVSPEVEKRRGRSRRR
jgi:hypothetical protein